MIIPSASSIFNLRIDSRHCGHVIKTEKNEMNNSVPRAGKADTDRSLDKDKSRSKMFSQVNLFTHSI